MILRNLLSNALKFTKARREDRHVIRVVPDKFVNVIVDFVESKEDLLRSVVGVGGEVPSSRGEPEPQLMLRVQVVDSGVGISKVQCLLFPVLAIVWTSCRHILRFLTVLEIQENIPKLFQEAVQFNPEKLQAGGGSGVGLWSEWYSTLCKHCSGASS